MTLREFCLLLKMRKTQGQPDGLVVFEFAALLMQGKNDGKVGKIISLKRYKGSLKSILDSLIKRNLVIKHNGHLYQVTLDGFHYIQSAISSFIGFLMKSVVIPIALSIATTLITLFLNGYFK